MWIRIKGQLYNLAHAVTVDCNLEKQFIMICFGSAGDKIDDCYTNYLRILSLLNLPEDDYDDFKREKIAD